MRLVGPIVALGFVLYGLSQRMDATVGLFLMLGTIGAWLRFNLRPTGYVTLTPLISFVALLLYAPYIAVLVASLSASIGSILSGRRTSRGSMAGDASEEALSMILSVVVFRLVLAYYGTGAAFTAAVIGYASCRLILTALRGKIEEDISPASTVLGAGLYLIGNIVLLAVVAFGVTHVTPISGRFGFLGLSLVTIALLEFYRPWKLLSQQADDLYASLAIIAEAIDIKDPYTGRHSRRVADVATKLARRLNLPEHDVATIRIGALLHDIGKIGVSGRIIRKKGDLESHEREAMQRHPVISAGIMKPVEYFREAALLVRHHHEHYDGSGYPDGLKAEEIPIGSRIILVADAYDAMTTDRPYRKGRLKHEALTTMKERAGKQFDARVVRVLQEVLD
jgi:putative nucleotidyltransferase with HDIG domain